MNFRPVAPGTSSSAASFSQTIVPLRSRMYIGSGTSWSEPWMSAPSASSPSVSVAIAVPMSTE